MNERFRHVLKEREASLQSPFRLGIIGFGTIGKVQYEALTQSPQKDFIITAIADHQQRQISDDRKFFSDPNLLLEDPDIQSVSINTPPNTHYDLAMNALLAGKHVLVEKPPVLTIRQCEELIRYTEQQEKILFMGFHARYNPAVEIGRQLLAGKVIKEVHIDYRELALNYHNPGGWIFDKTVGGGGVFMDSGINALSILTYVMPEPHDLRFHQGTFSRPASYTTTSGEQVTFNVETKAEVAFSFSDKGKGTIYQDWLHEGQEVRQITFQTEQNDIYTIDIVSNQVTINNTSLLNQNSRQQVDQHTEYRQMYKDFANCIATGKSLTSTQELKFITDSYEKGTHTLLLK